MASIEIKHEYYCHLKYIYFEDLSGMANCWCPGMTCYWVCNKIKTTGATSGAGNIYPSNAHEFIPCFSGVHGAQSLVFCAVFSKPLFVFLFFFLWSLCCLFFFLWPSYFLLYDYWLGLSWYIFLYWFCTFSIFISKEISTFPNIYINVFGVF